VTEHDQGAEPTTAPDIPCAPRTGREREEASPTEPTSEPGWLDRVVIDPIDDLQRRLTPVAFVVAIFKRFSEDRGSQYAALLSYYGFFSLLALLLVVATVSAMVLSDSPDKQKALVEAITGMLPVTGDAVASNVKTLEGSGFALVLGLLFVTWSGMGVVNNAQDAFNTMWSVPRYRWPNLWIRVGRSAAVLAVGLVGLLATTTVGALLSTIELGMVQIVLTAIGSLLASTLALLIVLELLTNERVGWRVLLPGAIVGGIALGVVQFFGTFYMTRVVARAGAFYGTFAAAFGVLIWLSILARVVLLAGEVSVVRTNRLYPRSLSGRRLGDPDLRALSDLVERESMSEDLVVDSAINEGAMIDAEQSGAGRSGTRR